MPITDKKSLNNNPVTSRMLSKRGHHTQHAQMRHAIFLVCALTATVAIIYMTRNLLATSSSANKQRCAKELGGARDNKYSAGPSTLRRAAQRRRSRNQGLGNPMYRINSTRSSSLKQQVTDSVMNKIEPQEYDELEEATVPLHPTDNPIKSNSHDDQTQPKHVHEYDNHLYHANPRTNIDSSSESEEDIYGSKKYPYTAEGTPISSFDHAGIPQHIITKTLMAPNSARFQQEQELAREDNIFSLDTLMPWLPNNYICSSLSTLRQLKIDMSPFRDVSIRSIHASSENQLDQLLVLATKITQLGAITMTPEAKATLPAQGLSKRDQLILELSLVNTYLMLGADIINS